jgi:hypothetical protein
MGWFSAPKQEIKNLIIEFQDLTCFIKKQQSCSTTGTKSATKQLNLGLMLS